MPKDLYYKTLENTSVASAEMFGDTSTKKVYIETYGCQMNFSDSEIVISLLKSDGYTKTNDYEDASLILINTCSIRDNAEQTIRKRLQVLNKVKVRNKNVKIGVLGCMAERLKSKLLDEERQVDMVVGPDAYRSLPALIKEVDSGQKAVNVLLSREETYADISPVKLNSNGVTAFISIMRGCDNMCSFCVVPFTRGRERSRDIQSITNEARSLFSQGYKEVTLLGQNVDSYKYIDEKGIKYDFSHLLAEVAEISPKLRVRFSTSHPKDMIDEVLLVMKKYDNICKYIHLPFQSGSSRMLNMMNRTYDREWYLERITSIRRILGDCSLSADIIAGFCSETESDHQDTLSLMEEIEFDTCYMFSYSERPGTLAARNYEDDIPKEVKKRRLQEIIALQAIHSTIRNERSIGTIQEVLIEGESKRSSQQWQGRTSGNKVVIIDKGEHKKGDYVGVEITSCTSATLFGNVVNC